MRVAFDARSLASSVLRGWDRYMIGLVGELVRLGVDVTLFHRERDPLCPKHVSGLGCAVAGLADKGGLAWEQIALPKALRRGGFDIYHAPAERGVPLFSPRPTVLTIHSVAYHSYQRAIQRGLLPGTIHDYFAPSSAWARGYWRAQVARAGHVVTPSAFCKEQVVRFLGFPPERVTVTPLAAAGMFLRPPKAVPDRRAALRRIGVQEPYLLYVGGYEPHKNVEGLLDVFAKLRASRPGLSLVMVGTGTLPESLRGRAERLGLAHGGEAVFLRDLDEELIDLYDGAELFISLSWIETFCLPILEALSRGLPVLASRWGGGREVAGDAGSFVDPADHPAVIEAIRALLDGERALDAGALRKRAELFTWRQTAELTLAVYRRLARSPEPRASKRVSRGALRIGFDARSLACPIPRGWDRYTIGLVRELARLGVSVCLFHRAREPLYAPHIAGLTCDVVGLEDKGGLSWEQVFLPLALKRGRFDLFHAPAEHGLPLAAQCPKAMTILSVTYGSYQRLIQRGMLPGPIQDYLSIEPSPLRRLWSGWYWKLQVDRADHIFANSHFTRTEIIELLGIPADRVTVTPVAVDEMFRRPPNPARSRAETLARLGVRKPYLLYVGGYETHKNVRGLLEVFANLCRSRPDLSLVLVGNKSLPEDLPAKARELGLSPGRDAVFLLNLNQELIDLYDEAELFVTLSWRETFPLAVLEAVMRGLRVVASDWGGEQEAAEGAGLFVDPRDHDGAVRAIQSLLEKPGHDRDSGRRVAERFTWAQTAKTTLQVYERLIAERRGRP